MRSRLLSRRKPANFPHLPTGFEPGAQSIRNRMRLPLMWWFVGIVGSAMLVAGLFVAAGGRGPKFDRLEELFGGLFFAGMGFLCAFVAYWQYRAVRPAPLRASMRGANLAVDRVECRRGDDVTATLSHHVAPKDLELGLVCVERFDLVTRSYTKAGQVTIRQTHEAIAHEQWQPLDPSAGEQTLSFNVPEGAPFSYEGDCMSYAWRVSARAVRRLRPDPRLDQPIWVRP